MQATETKPFDAYAAMNDVERRNYEKRPYKAYDRTGRPVYFKNLVDMRQGMETHGLTINPPGEEQPPEANPFRDYDSKSTEAVRDLCIARNVAGYMLMDKNEQIAALRALDKRDDDARNSVAPKKGK